jgi:hypothetical protein
MNASPRKRLDEIERNMRAPGEEQRCEFTAAEARAAGIECPPGTEKVMVIDNPGGDSHMDQVTIFIVRESTHPRISDEPDEGI